MSYFDVNHKGLAKLIDKTRAVAELISNSWDTSAKNVSISLVPIAGRPLATLIVMDDDPDGFKNLEHAYTLFAESDKKSDPTKRGRFNLGEKLVLSLCDYAEIQSTTGTVTFENDKRRRSSYRRDAGTVFEAHIRLTRDEQEQTLALLRKMISPDGVVTIVNDAPLARRKLVSSTFAELPTVIADVEGNLTRNTRRRTEIRIYEPEPGEVAAIYEKGVPIVEVGDRFHVDILQKVPLSLERDNVTPSYLKLIRAVVLNATKDLLDENTVTAKWVDDALESKHVEPEAVRAVISERYGDKRAVFDPSDREANMNLTAKGFHVVHGNSFSKEAWENIRAADALLPSGKIAPTPRPYSDSPDAPVVKVLSEEELTAGMKAMRAFVQELAPIVLGLRIGGWESWPIRFVEASNFKACCGRNGLDFSVEALGHSWFAQAPLEEVFALVLHELTHYRVDNHLEEAFHETVTNLGAKFAVWIVEGMGRAAVLRFHERRADEVRS